MRDPSGKLLKAWAKEYDEAPFFFEESSVSGQRLVAWSEEPEQITRAFYSIIDLFPQTLDVLLKISLGREPGGKPLWARYQGVVAREHLLQVLKGNETYVFSDGMHQLCLKNPTTDHYLAFDDHGIFFLYSPSRDEVELFRSLGFEERCAKPIYKIPHFQHTPPDSEKLEIKFVSDLGLEKVNSDLE